MNDEVLAVLTVSAPRRWFGLAVQGALGAMLIYLGFTLSAAFGWQVFLIAVGGFALWAAVAMHRATASGLELTRDLLRTQAGEEVARVAEITRVERGMFAFKPSNGFLITLSSKAPRAWRPGVWWRTGRRIGVGGVTSAPQAKFMAEMLTALINERGGQD